MNINKAVQSAFEYHKTGNLQQVELICKKILKKKPNNTDALHLLGTVYSQTANYDYAIKYFQRAVEVNPHLAETHNNLGYILQEKGHLDDAMIHIRTALKIKSNYPEAYNNMGMIMQRKAQLDDAINCYQKALQLNGNFIKAHNNLGTALREKGQSDEAINCFEKAIKLDPTSAIPYNNIGVILRERGHLDNALQYYRKAIQLNPNHADAHLNASVALLLSGNLKEGWKEYEWRQKTKDFLFRERSFSQPLWTGFEIEKRTILVSAEQGLGDTIHMIRYATLVAQRGAQVIIECQKELVSLLQNVEGVQHVVERGKQLPTFDVHCTVLSLPLIFDTTLESIPSNVPYIAADPIAVRECKHKIRLDNRKFNVGLVWSGNPRYKKDANRSLSLEIFAPLAQLQDVTFYSLQKGEAGKQAKNPPDEMNLIDYTEEINDFSDTASFIENLDLIMSVDTSVAHLAGAMAKPIWTLLPFAPDWRWMLNREDSPWYPTMRLFRQPPTGDWNSVITKVKDELMKLLGSNK